MLECCLSLLPQIDQCFTDSARKPQLESLWSRRRTAGKRRGLVTMLPVAVLGNAIYLLLFLLSHDDDLNHLQWTLYVWLAVVHLNSIATGGSCSSAAVLTFSTSYPTTSRLNESWNPLYFILFAPTISASVLVLFTLPNEFQLTLVYILDKKSPWTNPTLYTSSLHRTTMEQLPSVASPSQTNLTGL